MQRVIKLLVCAAIAALLTTSEACKAAGPTELGGSSHALTSGLPGFRLAVPYNYSPETRSAVIGPDGGVLNFGTGSISFPAGALERLTTISASPDTMHFAVTFSPHGIRFPSEARPLLTFFVGLPPYVEPQVAYVDDSNIVLELIPTAFRNGNARAPLTHFSTYVMGAH